MTVRQKAVFASPRRVNSKFGILVITNKKIDTKTVKFCTIFYENNILMKLAAKELPFGTRLFGNQNIAPYLYYHFFNEKLHSIIRERGSTRSHCNFRVCMKRRVSLSC